MINVWDVPVFAQVEMIVRELQAEIRAMGSYLLKDIEDKGRDLMVTCPAHKDGIESKPSCGISKIDTPRRDGKGKDPAGTVHCFTCGYKVDLAEFVSNCFGKRDRGMFGYKWIMSHFVSVAIEMRKPLVLPDMSRSKEESFTPFIPEMVLQQYRLTHPYMYQRKLTDKVIEYFDVGYDIETDSLTFPVHDVDGNAVLIQRRGVSQKIFKNDTQVSKGNYVYGLYQVYQNLQWITEVIICESVIDALYCWTARKPAVALMGASVTTEQINQLIECPVRKYIECLDSDEAGRKGAGKLKKFLGQSKLLYTAHLPEGAKDLNELTQEQLSELKVTIL